MKVIVDLCVVPLGVCVREIRLDQRIMSVYNMTRLTLSLLGLLFWCPIRTTLAEETLKVSLGDHRVVFHSGYRGLTYFPDEPISIISQKPFQFLMTAGTRTVLMQGRGLDDAAPIKVVLEPGGPKEFDNGYSGVASAYFDATTKSLYAFYHAEDHQNMPKVSYNTKIQGAYWSIGVAVLKEGAKDFQKAGPMLTASIPKASVTEEHQGIGNVSVVAEPTNTFLYAYYTDLTRRKGRYPARIAMARFRLTDQRSADSWFKYHNGRFSEKGLGGEESPVVEPPPNTQADVINPHVTYLPSLKRFFMLCNLMVHSDHEQFKAKEGGVHYCESEDGIRWTTPKRLLISHPIPYQGREFVSYPQLFVQRATDKEVQGWMLYAYSPRWGTEPPNQPHHLAKRQITISRIP